MNQQNHLVTVIIPVFNARPFLQECIQSVIDQTYKNIEIIAIEDGSSTHEDIVRLFPSVHYHAQAKAGSAAARNLGIKLSHGKYISFLDCDDRYTPTKTELQVAHLASHPEAQVVTGLTEEFLEQGVELPTWVREGALQGPHRGISPGTIMVRHELFSTVGLFDESLMIGSDTEWIKRIKQKSIQLDYLPTTVLNKRIHGHNQSAHQSRESLAQYRHELLKIFRP